MNLLKKLIRNQLNSAGYRIYKTKFIPYGFDFWVDVSRLSQMLGKKIDVVFDVGANMGDTSQDALKTFPDAQVFAFEPHPDTFGSLTQRITQKNFHPHRLALSNSAGESLLYTYEGESVLNSLVPDTRYTQRFDRKAQSINIEKSTIDYFCKSNAIKTIDILKIDTEGNDFNVILGAERMLRENAIGFIYFEFNDVMPLPSARGGSFNEISEYLHRFDFRFVATYTDYIVTTGDMFVVANGLMINPNYCRG